MKDYTRGDKLIADSIDNRMIYAYLNANEIFTLYISPGLDWREEPLEPGRPPKLFVWINITDPKNKTTWLELSFAKIEGIELMTLYNVTLHTLGELTVVNRMRLIFSSNVTGNYNFTIWGIFPGAKENPSAFRLYNVKEVVSYPYHNYVYAGTCLLILGIAIFAYFRHISHRRKTIKVSRRRKLHTRMREYSNRILFMLITILPLKLAFSYY